MEIFEIGVRFTSYTSLVEALNNFCTEKQCKFWKRDARTINSSRAVGVIKYINPDLAYYEIKYACIYGGKYFKSQSDNTRTREESRKKVGCPAYLRFKAAEDGQSLQLIAMNLKHNHELIVPKQTIKKAERLLPIKRRKNEILEIIKNECLDEDLDDQSMETLIDYNNLENFEIQQKQINIGLLQMSYRQKISFTFRGLIAPVFTPFDEDGSIIFDVIPEYSEYLFNQGITGVLVNGTSGEGMSMTASERKIVAEVWKNRCLKNNQHIMVQVGGANLPDTLDMARHAENIGVNSLLCLPELYFKPTTCEDLIQYLKSVGEAAPNTPLLYYHIPSMTNVNINMGTFLNKIVDQVPTFCGIKFTSTTLDEGIAAVKAQNKKYAVFLGADTIMAGAYALGFDSAIATTLNIFANHGKDILNFMKEGKIDEARSIQEQLNSLIEIITKNGSWVATMKVAMNLIAPFDVGTTRKPLKALNVNQITEMKAELEPFTNLVNTTN